MANLFLLLGAVFLIAGFLMKFWKSSAAKENNDIIPPTENVLSTSRNIDSISTKTSKNIPSKSNSNSLDNYDENKQKGDAFEKYVVQHFNRKFFTIMEWRSDKYVDGIYPVSNHFPDLEVLYTAGRTKDSFAIECKWRKSLYNNEVVWAQDYQIENYKKYAREVKLPVYIVIGIGGEPDNPGEIYIVPLVSAKTNVFTNSELLPYKKNRKGFYWDVPQKVLK